jgi:hypothetical protein
MSDITHTLANHDARADLTCLESMASGACTDWIRRMPNIPAKLFDYRVLTLEAEVQTDLAGILIINGPKMP